MEYSFHVYNKLATDGITMATDKLLSEVSWQSINKTIGAGMRSRSFSTLHNLKKSLPYGNGNAAANTPPSATIAAKTQNGATMPSSSFPFPINGIKTTVKHAKSPQNPPPPVVVCVGSDLAVGDSLGPITGSMLRYKTQGIGAFVYGTLAAPVTAREVKYMQTFLRSTHPNTPVLAIDAAVGNKGDVGLLRVTRAPLFPGAGANKKLGALGDVSILGIVAEKSVGNYGLLNTTRLNLVYSMAEILSNAVAALLWERCAKKIPQTDGKIVDREGAQVL